MLVRAVMSHFRRLQEECLGPARVSALLRTGSESLNPPVYLLSPLRPSTDHDSTSVQAHGHPEAPRHGRLRVCVRAVASVCVGGLDGPMCHRFIGSSGLYLVSSFKNDPFTWSLQSHTHSCKFTEQLRGHLQPVCVNVTIVSSANDQNPVFFPPLSQTNDPERTTPLSCAAVWIFPHLLCVCFFVALANTTLAHILRRLFFHFTRPNNGL